MMLKKHHLPILTMSTIACLIGCKEPGAPAPTIDFPPSQSEMIPAKTPRSEPGKKITQTEAPLKLELDPKTKQKIVEPELQSELLAALPEPAEQAAQDQDSTAADVLTRLQLGLENDTPIVGYKFKKRSTNSELPDVFPTPLSNATTGNIKEGKLQLD